jgi:multidrug resistance efflux pump
MTRRAVLALVLLTGWLLPVALAADPSSEATSQSKQKKAKQEKADATHRAEPERLKISVDLSGTFEADQMIPLALHPESWSTFTVIRAVPHGQAVKKGQKLVWLDTSDIDQQLADLKLTLQLGQLDERIAEANLQMAKASTPLDLAAAERAKRIAQEDLQYFLETERKHDEQSAEFSVRSSRQSLQYAQEELKQLEKMYQADDLTEETEEIILQRARNDVQRAEFYLKSAELRAGRTLKTDLPRRQTQMKEAATRAELELAKAKGSLPAQLEKQLLEYQKQRITNQRNARKLKQLQKDRQMMDITAPADGVVYYGQCKRGKWSAMDPTSSTLRRGGKLAPHSVFMTLLRPQSLHVRVDVPEKQLHKLRQGLQGTAKATGYPEWPLPVRLQRLSTYPVAEGTFDGVLSVELGEHGKSIVPGMTCQVTLIAYDKADALAVPAGAVFEDPEDGPRNLLYVRAPDGTVKARKVQVGRKTEQKWEIRKGLDSGELVLLQKPDKP